MWGGRYGQADPPRSWRRSTPPSDFDKRMSAPGQSRAPLAHGAMLAETGILSREDVAAISGRTQDRIRGNRSRDVHVLAQTLEEHSHEYRIAVLKDLSGPVGPRLHTGAARATTRVATDNRLRVRYHDRHPSMRQSGICKWHSPRRPHGFAGCGDARLHASAISPARDFRPSSALPMSRCWAVIADGSRMRASASTNARSGAAALAGTSFRIDREMTAKALGFDRPTANSLDSVADR